LFKVAGFHPTPRGRFCPIPDSISVREAPVTRQRGREYVEYYLSSEVQRYPLVEIGLALVIAGSWVGMAPRCSDERRA